MSQGVWAQVIEGAALILSALFLWLCRKGAKWIVDKYNVSEAQKEALNALLEGINKAQHDLVIDLKAKSADGKLTKEDIEKVREYAINHATDVVSGPAADVLMQMSKDRLNSWIRILVKKLS